MCEIFICLRSSFTYGAKLLNLILKPCEFLESIGAAYSLSMNCLTCLSIEELLGYGYAACFISVVQPWLPDLILASGSHSLLKQISNEGVSTDSSEHVTFSFPPRFHILARTEFCELTDVDSDDEERAESVKYFPAFKRLLEIKSELLKAKNEILDAVGVIYLAGSQNALLNRNFDVVLGLLHYVCVKLVRHECRQWKELKLMLISLEELYSKIEAEAEKPDNSEDDRKKLCSAKSLLESVWISIIYDERRQMEEE